MNGRQIRAKEPTIGGLVGQATHGAQAKIDCPWSKVARFEVNPIAEDNRGVKKIGVRLGNWLTAEQSHRLWQAPEGERLKESRDRALLAILLAGGLRRHEAVELSFGPPSAA